uniref:Uncharacterized protein n=1 Tax=Arundo donax TaxID=35708 RepID=A0A0A8Z870_ARUDO
MIHAVLICEVGHVIDQLLPLELI